MRLRSFFLCLGMAALMWIAAIVLAAWIVS